MHFTPLMLTEQGSASRSAWLRASLALALALVILLAMYWRTVVLTVGAWSNDPLAHGYFVLPFALYLVWQRRDALQALTPRADYVALPFVAACAFIWLLGNLADTKIVQQLSLIGLVLGFAWMMLGSSAVRVLLYPTAFLLFALPLGDRFIPVLQDLAARVAVKLLAMSGLPVLLQGHIIST